MIIKKRQILLATLIVALGAAVFVNWYYTKPDAVSAKTSVTTVTEKTTQKGKDTANLGDARYVISSDVSLSTVSSGDKTADEFFAAAKLRRSTAHAEANEALNDVIKDSASSAIAAEDAGKMLGKLAESLTLEADIENLITAKTGAKNLVILNNGKAEVIVEKGALNDNVILQIKEIVVKQTGYSVENITIIELNAE